MKILYYITILSAVTSLVVSSLDARPRKLDLSKRSRLSTTPIEVPKLDNSQRANLADNRFKFTEWHKQYSSIGRKKASVSVEVSAYEDAVLEMGRFERKRASIEVTADKKELAKLRNWNRVREAVMASKFNSVDITSPVGRHIQEMVDEVSLAQINRFQTVRNEPEDEVGIPVQQAAETGEREKTEALKVEAE